MSTYSNFKADLETNLAAYGAEIASASGNWPQLIAFIITDVASEKPKDLKFLKDSSAVKTLLVSEEGRKARAAIADAMVTASQSGNTDVLNELSEFDVVKNSKNYPEIEIAKQGIKDLEGLDKLKVRLTTEPSEQGKAARIHQLAR